MSNQGFFPTLPCGGGAPSVGSHVLSFEAAKMPVFCYNETNAVKYIVGAGTRMVVLSGGMQISGSAPIGTDLNNPSEHIPIGGRNEPNSIFSSDCPNETPSIPCCANQTPPIDCAVPIARRKIAVPIGHDGVVFFAARARNLGNQAGETGFYKLWIDVREDGVSDAPAPKCTSSKGIQGVSQSASQRTLSASFLTAGDCRLQPGKSFTATVLAQVSGNLQQGALSAEVPLIFFDDGGR
jgi:hypothetical protein